MDYLQMITDAFAAMDKKCFVCGCAYPREAFSLRGSDLVSNALVIGVVCVHCGKPLGTALVHVTGQSPSSAPSPPAKRKAVQPGWTKNDRKRLADLPAINYDDVVDAHQFFSKLGPDWSKHLPKAKS